MIRKPKRVAGKISDTMRLDWLEAKLALLDASCYWNVRVQADIESLDVIDGYGNTVRRAVDRAIRAELAKKAKP